MGVKNPSKPLAFKNLRRISQRITHLCAEIPNPDLEDAAPSPLDDWTITLDDPEDPANEEIICIAGFANHTDGGGAGIWLSPFFGEPGTEVDGTLSQTVAGIEGGDYTFSGWSLFEANYTADLTFMELAFLDVGDAVIGDPIMLDLSTEQLNDTTWREHALNGTAPAGTINVRISAGMLDGIDAGANPQSAFFDDFSLELALATPGDFDGDGDVDGDDFLVWQQGFGTIYDGDDFLIWQQNFGGSNGSGGRAIPEPATAALALLSACVIGVASRRRS